MIPIAAVIQILETAVTEYLHCLALGLRWRGAPDTARRFIFVYGALSIVGTAMIMQAGTRRAGTLISSFLWSVFWVHVLNKVRQGQKHLLSRHGAGLERSG